MSKRIVVVGNGMVGHRFIEEIVQSDKRSDFTVTTFCEEPDLAYDRVGLSYYFAGKTKEDLSLVEDGYYAANGIEVYIGDKVVSIDREAKTAVCRRPYG